MEKYGTGLTENIVLIEKMLDRISKTKKKVIFFLFSVFILLFNSKISSSKTAKRE